MVRLEENLGLFFWFCRLWTFDIDEVNAILHLYRAYVYLKRTWKKEEEEGEELNSKLVQKCF